MNLFDGILVLLMAGSCIYGFYRGLIIQIAGLLTMIVALCAAYLLTDRLAPWLQTHFPVFDEGDQAWLHIVSIDRILYSVLAFILIFLIVKMGLSIVVHILSRFTELPGIRFFNRVGGLLLALLQSFILSVLLVYLLRTIPTETMQSTIHDSVMAPMILQVTPDLSEELRNLFLGR
jgi:uncharacterized membrane protein required for colicin V production